MTNSSLLEFLYDALRSPHGVIIETDDVERLRQKLYAERRKADDESLSVLALVPSPLAPQSELWIVKARPDASNG